MFNYNNISIMCDYYPLLLSEKLARIHSYTEMAFYGYNSEDKARSYYNEWLINNKGSTITMNDKLLVPCLFKRNANIPVSILILPINSSKTNTSNLNIITKNRVENLLNGESARLNMTRIEL